MKKILLIILLLPFILQGTAQGQSPGSVQGTVFKADVQPVLTVYPNPSKDKKVTVELKNEELSEIKITNITGKEVFLQKLYVPVYKIQIELSNIPNGIYLLQAKSTNNKTIVKKLLISSN
jgi:hypothetical protein